ncbi:MAG: glutaredoxin [Nitrospira sp.]|nr:glutaredoxin [Nitrospira sp.]
MAVTFYHVNWCPECAAVREKLAELGLAYEDVVVPDFRPMRSQVYDVSGQYYVPVLKDGDKVLTETRDILAYLDEQYGKDGEGGTHCTPQSNGSPARGKGEEFPSCNL